MAKTFAEYAREREATMSPAQRDLMRAFDQAAAFGSVIFGARKARGLRQSDLAELSGVTQADISRIERGQVAPPPRRFSSLRTRWESRSSSCSPSPVRRRLSRSACASLSPAEPACAVGREVVSGDSRLKAER